MDGTWWIRFVLRVLPRSFRRRFGQDFTDTCLALAREAGRQGRLRSIAYIIRELIALLRLSLTLRARLSGPARDSGGIAMHERILHDLSWSIRHARRRPIPALAIVVTIALASAVTTTAYGAAAAVLWRPLPFDDAERLVFVWERLEREGQPSSSRVTAATYVAWEETAGRSASLALFGAAGFTMETDAGPTTVRGVRVSANYFSTLGIRPALGRAFTPEDESPGRHRVVILSTPMWRERFGARLDVIGSQFRLSGQPYTVIGVMPAVTFPAWPVNPADISLDQDAREFWVPIERAPDMRAAIRAHVFGVLARVHEGDAARLADRLAAGRPANGPDPHGIVVVPFRQQFVADARAPLLTLALASIALLLIACGNLAAVRASAFESRRPEFAVRIAIGASAPQLARLIVLELLLLVGAGSLLGLLLARAALTRLPSLLPTSIPFLTSPAVDGTGVFVIAGAALLALTLVSGWPVMRLLFGAPASRGSVRQGRPRLYRALVVSQVAIALAMTSAAGLLGESLRRVEGRPLGFDPAGVFVADVGLRQRPAAEVAVALADEARLLQAIAAAPGVVAAALAYDHPLEANWSENPTITGDATPEADRLQVDLRIVSPGYFDALGVEVLEGRPFTERDTLTAPGVVLVNEALARRLGGRVLGRRLRTSTPSTMFPSAPADFEIVGVAADERFRGLERPAQPAYYISTRQFPQSSLTLLVRLDGDPLAQAPSVRAAIRSSDPAVTVDRITTMDRILDEQLVARRVTSGLIDGFAATALGLAALGIYGLLMIAVAARQREIGIRLAVGASPLSVAGHTIRAGITGVATGVAAGIVLALLTGRLLRGQLVDVSPSDPVLLAGTALILLTTAAAAAAIPAWRASRVDPLTVLRQD
jgi:putative ABC transport system permease protein